MVAEQYTTRAFRNSSWNCLTYAEAKHCVSEMKDEGRIKTKSSRRDGIKESDEIVIRRPSRVSAYQFRDPGNSVLCPAQQKTFNQNQTDECQQALDKSFTKLSDRHVDSLVRLIESHQAVPPFAQPIPYLFVAALAAQCCIRNDEYAAS